MKKKHLLTRIAVNQKIKRGKPVIKGTWLTVEYILNLLVCGSTIEAILDEYQGLTQEDIQACFLFATKSMESTSIHAII